MSAESVNTYKIGIDEAGRGPCLGRVYAAAVLWDLAQDVEVPKYITDSKKLSSKQRQLAKEWILTHLPNWCIGFAEAREIDEINILEATRLAMSRALDDMHGRCPDSTIFRELLIDGVRWEGKFGERYLVTSVVGGDAKFSCISAASILAKEAHDDHIRGICRAHPEWVEQYDLLNNMGYATARHIDGLRKFGPCCEHRKSFHIRKLDAVGGGK
jgi:ribonuclease HII